MAITMELAEFVAGLRLGGMPVAVAERAKRLTLDFTGSVVRASAESDSTPCLRATLKSLGLDGPGPAPVPGTPWHYAPPVAALVMGMLGHSLDFDDTHADSSLHPSAPVVPAAWAMGAALGSSGAEILTAIVAGYEVCIRLGLALDPTAHYARGFHPTATAGVFGAAAAAGKLLGLDAAGIATAFGVAGSQAAGSLQFLANGAWNKRWQVGQAAMNGVIAASLARHGFVAAIQPIEGTHGLLAGYSGAPRPERAILGLGTVWETARTGVKPYPSCRYTHAALAGLGQLRSQGLAPQDFLQTTIGLHQNGITLTGAPIADKRRARSVVQGQFSMPFVAAVMIDQGRFGWDDYRRLGDPALDTLADRIDVVRDTGLEGLTHPFGATLRVTTPTGTITRHLPDPAGEPETFPDDAAVRAKFLDLAEPVLGARAAALADLILTLDHQPRLAA